MTDKPQLADVLQEYMKKANREPQQLANLTGIPKRTIVNWLQGHVARPREWQQLVKVCSELHLAEAEATGLMEAGGHPSIPLLWDRARAKEDIQLLSPWTESIRIRRKGVFFQVVEDPPHFVGREVMLKELEGAVLSGKHMTLYSLEGMPGVGKTALAARLCYQLRDYLADGVLWANLAASDAMSILSMFAYAYGFDVSRHSDLVSRSQAVRAILANKRALIVLDNAQRSEQIEPLLPPTGTCAVIITTRNRNLRVSRHASRFSVDVFDRSKGEAFDLFVRILGEARAEADKESLLEIADLLGQLPLALDIAASRLAYETGWLVSDFLERVRQESRRLSDLVYEDLSVRVAFNLSYDALTPELKQFFATLGVFEGDDFGIAAVAYVTGTAPDAAMANVRMLHGLSLVRQGRENRYQLHPLLRDYAREKPVNATASVRMVEFFIPYVETHKVDYDALAIEASNIHGALRTAFDKGMWNLLVRGSNSFYEFLDTRGLYGLANGYLKQAQQAALSLGDTTGLTLTLLNLGEIAERRGDYDSAQNLWLEALRLAHESGDRALTCTVLQELGTAALDRGELARAEELYEEALALAREIGDRGRCSPLLQGLGVVAAKLGDFQRAEEMFAEALACARGIGREDMETALLTNLGLQACRRGDYTRAEELYQQALELARKIDYRELICYLLINQIDLPAYRRDYGNAQRQLHEALNLAREIGHVERSAAALTALGWMAVSFQDFAQAETYLREALDLARGIGDREKVSFILMHLSAVEVDHGNYERAREGLQEALDLGRTMGNRSLIGSVLNAWGDLYLRQQQLDGAHATFAEALQLGQQLGLQELLANAKYGLARLAAMHGNVQDARREGLESLHLFENIKHYKALEVERWVTALSLG